MKTFEIVSWIFGAERQITVTEPSTLDSHEFRLKIRDEKNAELALKFDEGHWHLIDLKINNNRNLKQIDIDGIGCKIAKFWCYRLEEKLEDFKIGL